LQLTAQCFSYEANQGKDIASLDFAALDRLVDVWEAGGQGEI